MKKSDGFHIMVLPTSSILIRICVEFLIGQFILEVTFSIRLGPMRWVPTAHCAGRRGLNLLTAVSPVELAHCVGYVCGATLNPRWVAPQIANVKAIIWKVCWWMYNQLTWSVMKVSLDKAERAEIILNQHVERLNRIRYHIPDPMSLFRPGPPFNLV